MKKSVLALSADPITNGHINVIERALKVFDELTVAIGVDSRKKYTFDLRKRKELTQKALQKYSNVKVVSFEGLLVDFAYANSIPIIIRGLRNGRDFDYENELFYINVGQNKNIDTWFIPSTMDKLHISSSAAKELQRLSGMIQDYVPLIVKEALEKRISDQRIIGLTGEIGVGKSYVGERCAEIEGVHNIDMDEVAHEIFSDSCPLHHNVIKEVEDEFGTIDRKELGKIVFSKPQSLKKLNAILEEPILTLLRQKMSTMKGVILINAALIAEHDLAHWCNNNVIVVTDYADNQQKVLQERGLSSEQIDRRYSQYSTSLKLEYFKKKIRQEGTGKIWIVDNSKKNNDKELKEKLLSILKEIQDV